MIVSHVRLKNWRNFRDVSVPLGNRAFLVGPNASGKSNFLDAFRFLRDIAKPGGGLQKAVQDRGGISKLRCFAARKDPVIEIEVWISDAAHEPPSWRYAIGIQQESRGNRNPYLSFERVYKDGEQILSRPDAHDKEDTVLLTQTHLEQISANSGFREIARFIESTSYLHLVPQLVRHPKQFSGPGVPGDPFGRSFLERISRTGPQARKSRLAKIQAVLRRAVPQLTELRHVIDSLEGGVPHLEARYEHWRPNAGWQREADFSDGTLRLIGLFWMLLESDSLLLLEEPELSLNAAIVRKLPGLFGQMNRKRKRQILISTHSYDLLNDRQIGGEEVLQLIPDAEGTRIVVASQDSEIRALLEGGLTAADAVLSKAAPKSLAYEQLQLF